MKTNAVAEAGDRAQTRLTNMLQSMVGDAEHFLKSAQSKGTDEISAARDKFESQLKHAKNELGQLEKDSLRYAKRAAKVTDHAIKEHPYAAMGIAAAAAFLAGVLILRR